MTNQFEDYEDDGEDFSTFEIEPMMLVGSALGNAHYAGLTTEQILTATEVATEIDDMMTEDKLINFDHAIDAQIRLMTLVKNHYGRGYKPAPLEDAKPALENDGTGLDA